MGPYTGVTDRASWLRGRGETRRRGCQGHLDRYGRPRHASAAPSRLFQMSGYQAGSSAASQHGSHPSSSALGRPATRPMVAVAGRCRSCVCGCTQLAVQSMRAVPSL